MLPFFFCWKQPKSQGKSKGCTFRRLALRPEALERRNLLAAEVFTDLPDYFPGDTAKIFATGFEMGEAVRFQVLHNDGTPNTGNGHEPWEVTDGSPQDLDGIVDGNIQTNWYVDPDDSAGSAFTLTAEGLSSSFVATTTFTDTAPTVRFGGFGNLSGEYVNGTLGNANSSYTEGNSIPYRYAAANAEEGATITLNIVYQFKSDTGSDLDNTFDFLTSDDVTIPLTNTNRFGGNSNTLPPSGFGLTAASPGFTDTVAIPDDVSISTETGSRNFLVHSTFANTTIVSTSFIGTSGDFKTIQLVLQMGNNGAGAANEAIVDFAVFFGSHLARDIDYIAGNPAHEPNGAADAPGASYMIQINATQDRPGSITPSPSSNIQAGAVDATSLSWEKRTTAGVLVGLATFTVSPNPFGAGTLTVVDNGPFDSDSDPGQFRLNNIPFNTYTITETVPPAGYILDGDVTREQTVSASDLNAVVGEQGDDDLGITNESDFHNAPATASLNIVKTADPGQVANVAGEAITYTITVQNTGNTTLTGITVTDPNADAGSILYVSGDNAPVGQLNVGETWTFTATHTVTQAELDSNGGGDGDLDNTATADSAETPEDTSSATVPVSRTPALNIVKTADPGQVANVAGEAITYTITVQNTGNTTLTGITVTDPNADAGSILYVSGDNAPVGQLNVGETWTFTATHTVTQAELDSNGGGDGDLDNTATADSAETPEDTSSATVPVSRTPALNIVKTADPGQVANVAGEAITYTITVQNTGNTTLTGITVTDPNADAGSILYVSGDNAPVGQLNVGETWTFTATHTVTQAELDSNGGGDGDLDNTATADSAETPEDTSSATVPVSRTPALNIVKTADPGQVANVAGEAITYTITVQNTGNTTLTGITVTDPNADAGSILYVSGDNAPVGQLNVGETWTFTATHTVTQAELDSNGGGDGDLDNTATADSAETPEDTSSATVPVSRTPALNIVKTADPGQVANVAGEAITYTITVQNTGNTTLTGITVTDPNADAGSILYVSGDNAPVGQLNVGETWTFTATHTVTQAELDSNGGGDGDLDNTATADSAETPEDTSSATVPVSRTPALNIVKTADPGQVANVAGEAITYTITVQNTGNTTLTGITVTDPNADAGSILYVSGDNAPVGQLNVGETWTFTATHTVTQAELDSNGGGDGDLDNTATADSAETPEDTSSATVPIDRRPSLQIDKVASPTSVDAAGQVVTYSYTVENTGNVTLTNVTVSDDRLGTIAGPDSGDNGDNELDVGETWVYTATYTITQDDLDAGLDIVNVGTADSDESDPDDDTESVELVLRGGIDIEKFVRDRQGVDQDADSPTGPVLYVGTNAQFTYILTNTGNVALSNVVVSDDNGTPGNTADDFSPTYVSGDTDGDSRLDVGETWTFTAATPVIGGQFKNIGTVSAADPRGTVAGDTDPAHYVGVRQVVVIGPDKGNTSRPLVKIVDKTTGQVLREFLAYESSFKGGVRLATGDMDGDGIDEIITAPGRSRPSEIRVFTQEGVELTQYRTQAFPNSYKGGTEVAVGDVNGDGRNDIVAVPTEGRVEVRVFLQTGGVDPLPNYPSRQFYVFDKKFKGGADVTLADVGTFSGGVAVDATTPDGLAEIIVASGPGMRATVNVYDVTGTPAVIDTILPFANTFKGGVTVEAGRVNADAIPDFIFGSGNSGGSAVQIWDGRTDDLVDQALAGFYAFSNVATKNAPVHVTGLDLNGDGILDLLAAVQGTNGKSNQIRCFDTAGTPVGLPLEGFTGPWNIATIKSPAPALFLNAPPAPASPAATDAVFSAYTPPPKKKR